MIHKFSSLVSQNSGVAPQYLGHTVERELSAFLAWNYT